MRLHIKIVLILSAVFMTVSSNSTPNIGISATYQQLNVILVDFVKPLLNDIISKLHIPGPIDFKLMDKLIEVNASLTNMSVTNFS